MKKSKKSFAIGLLEKRIEEMYIELAKRDIRESSWMKTYEDIQKLEAVLNGVKKDSDKSFMDKIDVNVLINAGIGLVGILLILNYEKTEILTSKSLNIAMKLIGR